MKIIFYGITKKGADSFAFFERLDIYGLSCDINIEDGSITIHHVLRQLRKKVIHDILEIFDVEEIKTRQDDVEMSSNISKSSAYFPIYQEYLNFHSSPLTPNEKLSWLKRLNSESNIFSYGNQFVVREGDIVQCIFNSFLKDGLHGITNVLVFKVFAPNPNIFIGIPLLHHSIADNGSFFMNITYASDQDNIVETIVLHQMQPVSCNRCTKKIGSISCGLLANIAKRLDEFFDFSAEEAVTKFMMPAICVYNSNHTTDNSLQIERLNIFFNMMQITNDFELLRLSFEMVPLVKVITINNIVSIIKQRCTSFAMLKESTIEKKLRLEFLNWLNTKHPDIISDYKELSLLLFLKTFNKYTKV